MIIQQSTAELVALSNLVVAGLAEPQSHSGLMLAYAVSYADAGWKVFPLGTNKAPRIKSPHPKGFRCKGECGQWGHGVNDATTDISIVSEWWAIDYPDSGIGAAVPEGMFVLDTDPRKPGYLEAAALLATHGALPDTLLTISGRLTAVSIASTAHPQERSRDGSWCPVSRRSPNPVST